MASLCYHIKTITPKVPNVILELINHQLRSLNIPIEPRSLYDPIRYAIQNGGKRLRPQLVLLGSLICGGNTKAAVPAALAVELLHNFTLIHDDIMDSADTRRNQPSVFKKWDSNTAILSGDVLYAHSFEQLEYYGKDARYSKEQYLVIHQTFREAVVKVCQGQALDMEFESRETVSLDDYLEMINAKTAALLSCALKLGALVALAPQNQVDSASSLGYHAGIAFQVQDDMLDAVGDATKFGKKIGGDIRKGKKTWLTIAALNKASTKQKNMLRSVLKKDNPSRSDIEGIISLYYELHVIEGAQEAINAHYEKAQACLQQFENSTHRNEINNLLDQLMVRES
ncbi:MAG: polyprenyl synthetase family protein [Balneolales bacterium]